MNLNPVGWPGRGLQLFARLFNSGINTTTPVTAISEAPIGATNADIALVAKGTGATLAQVPDGTYAGGNKRGTYATDLQKNRSGNSHVASGSNSVIAGGGYNTASGSNSVIAGGGYNTAAGSNSVIAGGNFSIASNSNSAVLGGDSNTASGVQSVVCGGYANSANGTLSFVSGGRQGTARGIEGYHVFPACAAPISDIAGITQSGLLLLGRETTTNLATVLTSNTASAGSYNQVILPNNSAYSFSGEVIAGVTSGGNTARWTINGAIKRGFSAASTALVGTPTVTMTHNDAGAATWSVAIGADTTYGGLSVTVIGAVGTTIRWVCKINTTEMTY